MRHDALDVERKDIWKKSVEHQLVDLVADLEPIQEEDIEVEVGLEATEVEVDPVKIGIEDVEEEDLLVQGQDQIQGPGQIQDQGQDPNHDQDPNQDQDPVQNIQEKGIIKKTYPQMATPNHLILMAT